jgi:hypothetical protein
MSYVQVTALVRAPISCSLSTPPMIGASGLCYLDLVKLLPAHLPVLALDDGCLSNGAPFVFDSIDDVVSACMLALAKVRTALKLDVDVDVGAGHQATSPPPMRLLLAGWSYGGVVAIELARRLSVATSLSDSTQQSAAGPSPSPSPGPNPVQVVGVCLFDSPLVRPAPRSVDNAGTRTALNTSSSNTKIYTPQGPMLIPPPPPARDLYRHRCPGCGGSGKRPLRGVSCCIRSLLLFRRKHPHR